MRPDLDLETASFEAVDPVIADKAQAQRRFGVASRTLTLAGFGVHRSGMGTYLVVQAGRVTHLHDLDALEAMAAQVRRSAP